MKRPPDSADRLCEARLLLLDVIEEVAGIATLLREGVEIMESDHVVSDAQMCAADASDAVNDAVAKLRTIRLKCEEFAQ